MKAFRKNGKVARFAGYERMDSSMKRFWTVLAVLLLTLSLTGILAAASPAQDMNADGVVDEGDLKLLLQYLVGKNDLPEGMTEADLDLNGNGEVDIYEAVLVLQYIEGIIPELPGHDTVATWEQKVPQGVTALLDGEVYRFGETFCGYSNYVVVGEDGQALVAGLEEVVPITDDGRVYTNCFLAAYQVYVGTLAPTRSGELTFVPQKECALVQVMGGTPAEQEQAKDVIRAYMFDYDNLSPEEQAMADALLEGAVMNEDSADPDLTYGLVLNEDGTVASAATYDGGRLAAVQVYTYVDGLSVRTEQFDGEGESEGYYTITYHENGTSDTLAEYSADGVIALSLHKDERGNIVGAKSYRDGVLEDFYRATYDYNGAGKLARLCRYVGTKDGTEVLEQEVEWYDDGDVRSAVYYPDGTLSEEMFLYADGSEESRSYDQEGRLSYESAYNAEGELKYTRSYDEGVLIRQERVQTEVTSDGVKIRRTYLFEAGEEEYLSEVTICDPDGSVRQESYDPAGELSYEREDTTDGWWEKRYENGILREEAGGDDENDYHRYYDEEGNFVDGYRIRSVFEGDRMVERLEYAYSSEGEYLYCRTEYDERSEAVRTTYYHPDGSVERCEWLEVYTEDGCEIRVSYEQYGDMEPQIVSRVLYCENGSWRHEEYREGDLVRLEGEEEGRYYYAHYEYQWDETGKWLWMVSGRMDGEGYYDVRYYPNGSYETYSFQGEDGTVERREYYPDGTLRYEEATLEDGSRHSKRYYENGVLEHESCRDARGNVIFEAYYDPDGSVTYSVRYENEYSQDGDLLVLRKYETDENGYEYLAQVTEYTKDEMTESNYDPEGNLLERIRRETVFAEETGYIEERVYKQYGDGEEFLYSLARYDEYDNVLYSIQMDEDGDPIYEEIPDESGWDYDTKEWDYEYDEEGNKYPAAYYEHYFDEGYRETYYLPDGTVVYDHYNYYDGRFMISEKDFYENGTLRYEHYEDNVTAWEKYYYEDGSLMAEAYGEADGSGVRYVYYASGKLQEEYHQEADGSYRQVRYYESGVVQEEECCDHKGNRIKYVVYLEDGTITEYDRNEYDYLDDGGFTVRSYRLNAAGTEWMESECAYDESYNLLVRKQYTLDDNGNAYLYSHEYYDQDGNFIEKDYELNDAGEAVPIYESVTGADGSYASKSYDVNGTLRNEYKEDAEGNGYYREYTADGVLVSESIYNGENGETNIEYDEEGNVIYYARWVTVFDEYGNDIGNRVYALDENGNEYLSAADWVEGDVHVAEVYNTLGVMTQKWEEAPEYEKTWSYVSDENGVWYLDEYRCFYENGSDEYECYYPGGTLKQSHFLDAEGNGKECLYYESGALQYERIFDGDVETNITYDEEGNITKHTIATHLYEETYSEVVTYTRLPDGTEYLSRLERYFDDEHWESFEYDADGDGIYEGRNTEEGYSYWYATYRTNEQGVKYLYCRSDHFVDESYHSVYYYENGQKASAYFFDVDRNGYEKQYYENGALWKEYRFEWNEEVYYACYDEEGNLTESRGEAA